MNRAQTPVLAALSIALICLAAPVAAEEDIRYETLPGQPTFPFIVDVWNFHCPAGGSATVSVDTVALASGGTMPLDPVIEVYAPSGTFMAFADDEVACSVVPVCGFACPLVNFDCSEDGEHLLLVQTATSLGCGESTAPYELTVEVFDGLGGGGTPLPASQVGLGGGEPIRSYDWGRFPSGPALDDQFNAFFLPTSDAAALERQMRLRNKTRPTETRPRGRRD